jgi:CHAT domain-containing protein/Tfp pilus assembly protein PilF
MKAIKIPILLSFFSLIQICLSGQSISMADTAIVKKWVDKAFRFADKEEDDSARIYFENAGRIYLDLLKYSKFKNRRILENYLFEQNNLAFTYIQLQLYREAQVVSDSVVGLSMQAFGERNKYEAYALSNKSTVLCKDGMYKNALDCAFKGLDIEKQLLGDNNAEIARIYCNIGMIYNDNGEYDKALEYQLKSLRMRTELPGENQYVISVSYSFTGSVYTAIGEYEVALDYFKKSLNLLLKLYGEKYSRVAQTYNNMAMVYYNKGEFDLALEYFLRSSNLRKEVSGEKNPDQAGIYSNIGTTLTQLGEYDQSMEYLKKALALDKETFGENHPYIAADLNNIGENYSFKADYNKALEFHFMSLKMKLATLSEKHPDVAYSYSNIALAYEMKGIFDSASIFYTKALMTFSEAMGKKHPLVAVTFRSLGLLSMKQHKYDLALKYFQSGLVADIKNYFDSLNIYSNPKLSNYLETNTLCDLFGGKAEAFYELKDYKSSLIDYIIADSIISIMRKASVTKADKLKIGESASHIYDGAIKTCMKLADLNEDYNSKNYYIEKAFYFSEEDKAGLLLEALAGQEGLKFAGIPDSMLQLEHKLKTNISFKEKRLADVSDSSQEAIIRNNLFQLNRKYDELSSNFEKNYPEYYNLKYSTRKQSIKDIQILLDNKTAIRNYILGDSDIYIFTITHKNLDLLKVPKICQFEDTIQAFRDDLASPSSKSKIDYLRIGNTLFRQLFPDISSVSNAEKNSLLNEIENLVIIPDGSLGIIPFEALLSENYSGQINKYQDYPFLIKRFNISYSYSANLFYRTFTKFSKHKIELSHLNDWLAFAPVFDEQSDRGMLMSTRELNDRLNKLKNNTPSKRSTLLNGDFVTPLPGTENETQAIFKEYDTKHLKAEVLLHKDANEQFIKSGGLENFKIIHFATHGFVNSEKPELSGILLNQDTIGGQDGILYAGEIYNLNLNADLIVLSACETGLGKIMKGEGIIGLTRALLYAGTRNIIVSLWQVSDQSTSDLMIDFYDFLLKGNRENSYSECLRKAKLKMIAGEAYSHPFYWSPFILIGK